MWGLNIMYDGKTKRGTDRILGRIYRTGGRGRVRDAFSALSETGVTKRRTQPNAPERTRTQTNASKRNRTQTNAPERNLRNIRGSDG